MSKIPLEDMADKGYDNMPEWAGYILSEWKQHANVLAKQIDAKLENTEFSQLVATIYKELEKKVGKQDLADTLVLIESQETKLSASLASLWKSSEFAFAPASLKKDLQDVISLLDQYETKAESVAVTSQLSNKIDEVYEGRMLAKSSFDFSDQPLDGTFNTTLSLPAGYVLRSVWYEVTDTFTSDDTTPDSTTLKLSMESDGDLKAAIAISDAGSPYDAGFQDTLVTPSTESDNIRLTESRILTVEVTNGAGATAGLTAGSMKIYAEYYKA